MIYPAVWPTATGIPQSVFPTTPSASTGSTVGANLIFTCPKAPKNGTLWFHRDSFSWCWKVAWRWVFFRKWVWQFDPRMNILVVKMILISKTMINYQITGYHMFIFFQTNPGRCIVLFYCEDPSDPSTWFNVWHQAHQMQAIFWRKCAKLAMENPANVRNLSWTT